jgi:hypothetical protein
MGIAQHQARSSFTKDLARGRWVKKISGDTPQKPRASPCCVPAKDEATNSQKKVPCQHFVPATIETVLATGATAA